MECELPKEEDFKEKYYDLLKCTRENYLHKKVAAADQYEKSKHVLACCGGMMVLTLISAAASKNWYSILFGSLSIGWGAVFLVKAISLRKYLAKTYDLDYQNE